MVLAVAVVAVVAVAVVAVVAVAETEPEDLVLVLELVVHRAGAVDVVA